MLRRALCKSQGGGKLEPASALAEVDVVTSNRLCVYDRETGEKFLVDTGADISVIAARNRRSTEASPYKLFAANNTPIRTYGEKTLKLNLGLRRDFQCTFIVADVKTSILRADFLRRHKLLVDLHNRKIIDGVTELAINGLSVERGDVGTIRTVSIASPYYQWLSVPGYYPTFVVERLTKT